MNKIRNYLVYGLFVAVIIVFAGLIYNAHSIDSKPLFNKYLSNSKYVYIVMDLEDAVNNKSSDNIMQCGVDFAGSLGGMKIVYVYAISKNNTCYYNTYITDKYSCFKQLGTIKSEPIIYIRQGDNTTYVDNIAYVGVNDEYKRGTCSVKLSRLSK